MVSISRARPGCIVFMVNRSSSMGRLIGSDGQTLAHLAADTINYTILQLIDKSTKGIGEAARDYFYIGVFGYGIIPEAGAEGVASAFKNSFLLHTPIAPISL